MDIWKWDMDSLYSVGATISEWIALITGYFNIWQLALLGAEIVTAIFSHSLLDGTLKEAIGTDKKQDAVRKSSRLSRFFGTYVLPYRKQCDWTLLYVWVIYLLNLFVITATLCLLFIFRIPAVLSVMSEPLCVWLYALAAPTLMIFLLAFTDTTAAGDTMAYGTDLSGEPLQGMIQWDGECDAAVRELQTMEYWKGTGANWKRVQQLQFQIAEYVKIATEKIYFDVYYESKEPNWEMRKQLDLFYPAYQEIDRVDEAYAAAKEQEMERTAELYAHKLWVFPKSYTRTFRQHTRNYRYSEQNKRYVGRAESELIDYIAAMKKCMEMQKEIGYCTELTLNNWEEALEAAKMMLASYGPLVRRENRDTYYLEEVREAMPKYEAYAVECREILRQRAAADGQDG